MAAAAAPLLAALQALGLATQADLAPLATQAQVAAAVAPLATQAQVAADIAAAVAALQVQVAALPSLAQINAAILAALAPHNAPAVAAAASAIAQSIGDARRRNRHDLCGVPLAVVPRADGTPPPNWPAAGFCRDSLVEGPIAAVDALLADYGLPSGPPTGVFARRNALAHHLGAPRA
jgi:hypothetical protein